MIRRFLADESAATAIEYALLASLIAMAIVTTLGTMGTRLNTKFSSVSGALR